MWSAAPLRAHELLVTEAARIERTDRRLAALLLADAAIAACSAAEIARAVETARRAMRIGRALGGETEGTVSAIGASVLLVANRGRAAKGLVRTALARVSHSSQTLSSDALQILLQSATALFWVEEYVAASRLLDQVIARARVLGAPQLPTALDTLAAIEFRTGQWPAADAHSAEALRLARDRGRPFEIASAATTLARIAAARGGEAESRALLELAADHAGPRTLAAAYAASASGFLELSLGHADAAIRELEPLNGRSLTFGPAVVQGLPDLIEAYARSGRRQEAGATLARFEALARANGGPLTRAAAARCRGLLAPAISLDADFEEGLRLHAKTVTPFERARTELCWGERLRRSHRRAEAAVRLRSALATFELQGAVPWADRARRELAPLRRADRAADTVADLLTQHELRVASLVRSGATNREAGTALFVTPKTIEYHLGSIYRKLGIRSRTELAVWLTRGGGHPGATDGVAPSRGF